MAQELVKLSPATDLRSFSRKLSPELRHAISDSFGLTIAPSGDGYAWQPPAFAAPVVIESAKRAAAYLEEALRPSEKIGVRAEWLASLGLLVAGKIAVADVKAKLAAYAPGLEYPDWCFTRETMYQAGRQFSWFPSFAEISKFLEELVKEHHERLRRLKAVAAARIEEPKPPVPAQTPEERQAFIDATYRKHGLVRIGDAIRRIDDIPPAPESTETAARAALDEVDPL